jgi:hypothetical protein
VRTTPTPSATWQAYAGGASSALAERLARTDDPHVVRLQAFLQQHPDTASAAPLVVSLWIDAGGMVIRSQFDALGDAQADAPCWLGTARAGWRWCISTWPRWPASKTCSPPDRFNRDTG